MLSPLTGGASSINVYGSVGGSSVYRPNALTGDPNHLGIMLIVPLLVLLPVYLRLERGHPRKKWLAVALGFMLVVLLSTLSRSGLLGLGVGLLVLALPYRRFLWSRALLAPLAAVALLLAYVLYSRWHYFSVVLRSRVQTGGASSSAHFAVYDFIPQIIHSHPLLGLGLNNVLRLLRVRDRQDELGAALVLGRADRRDGARRPAALLRVPPLRLPAAARGAAARPAS